MEKVSMCLNRRIESGYINFQKDNDHKTDLKQMSELKHACWNVNNKYRNLPVYVDTRCKRHKELPAKLHILRTQQTPGIH